MILTLSGCGITYEPNLSESAPVSESTLFSDENSAPEESSNPETNSDTSDGSSESGSGDVSEPVLNSVEYVVDQENLAEKLSQICDENHVVGMTVCAFANGEVIYTGSFGYADKGNKILCDENTKYRVASVSKLISTIALMTLYDEGKLTPDSDLKELCGLDFSSPYSDKPVLLWHLLTHTAGLVDTYVYQEVSATEKYSSQRIINGAHSGFVPGEYYLYSNFGMGLVGSVAERITDEFFHDFADRALFEPLGMDAGYTIDFIEDKASLANVYYGGTLSSSPKNWDTTKKYYESFGMGNSYYTANCELLISAPDLARLAIVLAGDGTVGGVRVLSEEAVNLINSVYYVPKSPEEAPHDMGLSVRIYRGNLVSGRNIYGHPGCSLGMCSGLYYDPSDGTGVVMINNGSNFGSDPENGVYYVNEDVVRLIYENVFGNAPDPDIPENFDE